MHAEAEAAQEPGIERSTRTRSGIKMPGVVQWLAEITSERAQRSVKKGGCRGDICTSAEANNEMGVMKTNPGLPWPRRNGALKQARRATCGALSLRIGGTGAAIEQRRRAGAHISGARLRRSMPITQASAARSGVAISSREDGRGGCTRL